MQEDEISTWNKGSFFVEHIVDICFKHVMYQWSGTKKCIQMLYAVLSTVQSDLYIIIYSDFHYAQYDFRKFSIYTMPQTFSWTLYTHGSFCSSRSWVSAKPKQN